MLVDPHTQGQRTVQDCSSRDEVWYVLEADHQFDTSLHVVVTRATEKHHTAHEARLPNPGWVFKDDVGKAFQKVLVQDHRAHCLQQHARMSFGWRRASHVVSFRGPGCVNRRSHRM